MLTKKDKSVSTENIFKGRNNNKKRLNSLFNNQLLASLTIAIENKFFLTTGDNKNKIENNKGILIHPKQY